MENDNEYKTITEWVLDPICTLKKQALFNAITTGRLRASRPVGGRTWRIYKTDLLDFLKGETNA